MIEMNVEFVRVSMQNYNRVVILKEKESERYLLIWIGPSEAEAIAMRLGEVQPPRPQTHDLLRNIIESLDAQVSYVLVNDLNNNQSGSLDGIDRLGDKMRGPLLEFLKRHSPEDLSRWVEDILALHPNEIGRAHV